MQTRKMIMNTMHIAFGKTLHAMQKQLVVRCHAKARQGRKAQEQ
jgi:hypothetical protein